MRNNVKKAFIVINRNSTLPFFVLTLFVELDCKKLKQDKIFPEIKTSIHPLRAYFDDISEGIFKKSSLMTPACPYFTFLDVRTSFENYAELTSKCHNLTNYNPENESDLVKIMDSALFVKEQSPFNSLDEQSLLSTYGNQNVTSKFTGLVEWYVRLGILTPFMITVFPTSEQLSPRPDNALIPILHPDSLLG